MSFPDERRDLACVGAAHRLGEVSDIAYLGKYSLTVPVPKKLLATLVFCCFAFILSAQYAMDGYSQLGKAGTFTLDAQGHVAVALQMSSQTLGNLVFQQADIHNLAIAKFDSTGNLVQTSVSQGANMGNSSFFSQLSAFPDGSIAFGGSVADSLLWDSTLVEGDPNGGLGDIYVMGRLNAAGALAWMSGFRTGGLVLDSKALSNGNLAIVGNYVDAFDFNGFQVPATPSQDLYGFVMIVDSLGAVQSFWPLEVNGYAQITGLDEGPQGDLFLTGNVTGSSAAILGHSIIGPNPTTKTFLARLTQAGSVAWVKSFVSSGTVEIGGHSCDKAGNSYFSGTFTGALAMDNQQFTALPGERMFAGKLDSSGTALWMIASSGSTSGGQVYDIQAHDSGKILLTGVLPFGNSVSFGGFNLLDTLGSQHYLMLLDSLGAGIWAEKIPVALTTYGFGVKAIWEDADHIIVGGGYHSGSFVHWDYLEFPTTWHRYAGCFVVADAAWWARIAVSGNLARGMHYADMDQDGQLGPGDRPIAYAPVSGGRSIPTITDSEGKFAFVLPSGTTQLQAFPPSPLYAVANSPLGVQFSGIGAADSSLTIRSVPLSNATSYQVAVIAAPQVVHHDNFSIYLNVKNLGTIGSAASLTLTIDTALSFTYTGINPGTVNGNQVTWDLSQLGALQEESKLIGLSTHFNAVYGDTLTFVAEVVPVGVPGAHEHLRDTARSVMRSVNTPVSKRVSPGLVEATYLQTDSGWINFAVRFENTGSYGALSAELLDSLPTELDIESIQVLGTSHPCKVNYLRGHVLRFTFDPATFNTHASNYLSSTGFVHFRIRVRDGAQVGDSILNQVNVQLDRYTPISSNPAVLHIRHIVSLEEANLDAQCSIFPIPSDGKFTLRSDNGPIVAYRVSDMTGHIMASAKPRLMEVAVDLQGLPAGVYMVNLQIGKTTVNRRLLIQ